MTSNIYFYTVAGYFSPGATETPLLHYWSLGVEEQFYLIFPVLLGLGNRFLPRLLPLLTLALLVVSLVASQMMLAIDPSAAFYLLPYRAFELLMGCVLALPSMPFPRHRRAGSAAVGAGLVLLVGGMMFITASTPFPGIAALIPCLGAALTIWGGDRANSLPKQMLSSALPVFFGRISYSLYLVHWPLVVFGAMALPELRGWPLLIAGVGTSTLLAWLSYRFVEQPVRNRRAFFSRRVVFTGAGLGVLLLGLAALPTIYLNGFAGRQSEDVNRVLAYGHDYYTKRLFREGECFLDDTQGPLDFNELTCLPNGADIVLYGSSRMAQIYWGLEPLLHAQDHILGQMTASGCAPLQDYDVPNRPRCKGFNKYALDKLIRIRPSLVIMGGDALYSAAEIAALDKTIAALHAEAIPMLLIGPLATYSKSVPLLLAERIQSGNESVRADDDMSLSAVQSDAAVTAAYQFDPRITYVRSLIEICELQGCLLSKDGVPLYFDQEHFTVEGGQYYARLLVQSIDRMVPQPQP